MLSSVATSFLRRGVATSKSPLLVAASLSRHGSTIPASGGGYRRSFSDDRSSSHDDFAPKRKVVEGEDEALKMIREHVTSNPIMLYMKGTPTMPMCGFSARVVQTLKEEGVDFSSVNVLDYPDIREGVKKFS